MASWWSILGLSPREMAVLEVRGRRISHTHVSTEEMAERLIKRGLPEATARFLAFGYATIAVGAADRTTDVVRMLIGTPPTTFQTFAEANADVWRRVG